MKRIGRQSNLLNFIKRTKPNETGEDDDWVDSVPKNCSTFTCSEGLSLTSNLNQVDKDVPSTSNEVCPESKMLTIPDNDVADVILKKLTDEEKITAIKNLWTPSVNYKFPSKQEGKYVRKFKKNYLENYSWLVYSAKQDGVYCKYCVFFFQKKK